MAYTTRADVKTFLGISATTDDDLLDMLLTTAQQMVDTHCGRTFEASSDTTRTFDATSPTLVGHTLFLDTDLCQITQVVNGDGTTLASSDYVTVPSGTPPYHALVLLASSGATWTYTDDPQGAIAITGRWAYAVSAPAPVVHATKELVAWLYRSYDRQAVAESGVSGGAGNAELPAVAQTLLNPYRRLY